MIDWIRYILSSILRVVDIVLLVYCVSSWVIRDPYNKFYSVLCSICDPVLDPIRSILRRIPFFKDLPIDFSPWILMMILYLLMNMIVMKK